MARRKNKDFRLPLKPIIPVISAGAAAVILGMALKAFFLKCPYFNIDKVRIEGVAKERYQGWTRRLIGGNIFLQDLSVLKDNIENAFNNVECLLVRRSLPGELVFSLKERIPVAQLNLGRFYLVDQSGAIIGRPSDLAFEALTVIEGVEERKDKARSSKFYSLRDARQAVELIQEKKGYPDLGHYRITRIKASRNKVSSFFIISDMVKDAFGGEPLAKKELEIRFDLARPKETAEVLALFLAKRRASLPAEVSGEDVIRDIEYIDLKDPAAPAVMEKKSNKNN